MALITLGISPFPDQLTRSVSSVVICEREMLFHASKRFCLCFKWLICRVKNTNTNGGFAFSTLKMSFLNYFLIFTVLFALKGLLFVPSRITSVVIFFSAFFFVCFLFFSPDFKLWVRFYLGMSPGSFPTDLAWDCLKSLVFRKYQSVVY